MARFQPTELPLVVGPDPHEEGYFSVWTNVDGAINAEIAGRIGNESDAWLLVYGREMLAALERAAERVERRSLTFDGERRRFMAEIRAIIDKVERQA